MNLIPFVSLISYHFCNEGTPFVVQLSQKSDPRVAGRREMSRQLYSSVMKQSVYEYVAGFFGSPLLYYSAAILIRCIHGELHKCSKRFFQINHQKSTAKR